jgi:hypothetical protein
MESELLIKRESTTVYIPIVDFGHISKYRRFGIYSMKNRDWRKILVTRANVAS